MTITIGRFNIPGILISGLISYILVFLISQIIIKDKVERKKTLEIISNALFIGFFTWKLSPVFNSFSLKEPLSFLFLPGGTLGSILALILSLLYISFKIFRNSNKKRLFLSILFIFFTIVSNSVLITYNSKSLNRESISTIVDLGIDLENEKPSIINFWATWCSPCKSEIPELNEFYNEHKNEINFYGVNMSSTEKGTIDKFIEDYNMEFPIVLDSESNISNYFEIKSIPTTIIITKKGDSYYMEKYSGAVTKDVLKSAIR